MNADPNRSKGEKTATLGNNGRVAFRNVTNRPRFERPRHAKGALPHKRTASTARPSLRGYKLANNDKNGVAARSAGSEDVPPASKPCRGERPGALPKRAPARAGAESHPGELARPAARGTPAAYQDGLADDVDKRDADDPGMATAYVQEMYRYFKDEEDRAVVGPYMTGQPAINARMRSILVDWICRVHFKMKCEPETLYLAVSIIDRYLSAETATKENLQLIGASAMLIASKYEQIYPVEVECLLFACGDIYNKKDILKMEDAILSTLDYRISVPTIYNFFLRYLNAGHANMKLVYLASYLLEESLLSYDVVTVFKPSQLAAAAILIGRHAIGRNKWSPTLLKYSHYREEDVVPVARMMLAAKYALSPELDSFKKKYSRSCKHNAASIALPAKI